MKIFLSDYPMSFILLVCDEKCNGVLAVFKKHGMPPLTLFIYFCSYSVYNLALMGFMQLLGVNNGAVELDAPIMGIQQEGKKIKVPLNSR